MPEPELEPPDDGGLLRPLPPVSTVERIHHVVRGLRDEPGRLATVVLGVLGLGALVLWLWSAGRPPPPPPELSLPMATTAAPDDTTASTPAEAAEVVVHAAGAVAHPGIYALAAGSRVADLLVAAGGAAAGADTDRVNLAAPLVDGQRVYVPRLGEPVAPETPASSGGGGGGSPTPTAPVDINTATLAELDALPGIGPTTATAIIEYRERNGPFRAVDELLEVAGIGEAKLADLRPLVRV